MSDYERSGPRRRSASKRASFVSAPDLSARRIAARRKPAAQFLAHLHRVLVVAVAAITKLKASDQSRRCSRSEGFFRAQRTSCKFEVVRTTRGKQAASSLYGSITTLRVRATARRDSLIGAQHSFRNVITKGSVGYILLTSSR